jgi:hypothetical protein
MGFHIKDFIHQSHATVGIIQILQRRIPSFLDLQKIKTYQYLKQHQPHHPPPT